MNQAHTSLLVTAYVNGWITNNLAQILETLTTDCLIIESHGPTYRGHELVRAWITSWFDEGGRIHRWDITSLYSNDDAVAFEWVFECSGSWGHSTFEGATIVRFENERISYLREYRCTEPPYSWKPQS
jgi:hypothetical protein